VEELGMLDSTITWGDLFKTVIFILAAGALFYLLLAAANLVGILKNIRKTLEKNRESIDNTLEKLPEITDNVAKVSEMIKNEMESIEKVVKNVGRISESAKDAAEVLKNDILVKAKGILDVIDWIRKLFEKDDRKKEIVYKYKYRPDEETIIVNNDSEQECCGGNANDCTGIKGCHDGNDEPQESKKVGQSKEQQGAGI